MSINTVPSCLYFWITAWKMAVTARSPCRGTVGDVSSDQERQTKR